MESIDIEGYRSIFINNELFSKTSRSEEARKLLLDQKFVNTLIKIRRDPGSLESSMREDSRIVELAKHLGLVKENDFVLDIRDIIINAIKEGKIDLFKEYIFEVGNDVLSAQNGYTALHYAAAYGNLDFFDFFLTASPETDIDTLTLASETPLMIACMSGHAKIVKFLLTNGANLNVVNLEGKTALEIAFTVGNEDIVNRLLEELERRETTTFVNSTQIFTKNPPPPEPKPKINNNSCTNMVIDLTKPSQKEIEKTNKELEKYLNKIIDLEQELQEKENITKKLEELLFCRICTTNNISSVFGDCYHAILCYRCALNLSEKQCPLCFTKITKNIIQMKGRSS